ncbi:hypothetical protein PQR37_25965 [Paraburkholderia nemoris]|uniref:hypothetical protein n=1 Tax=Paraburkholderia nemoris TaxID=2793076 RepID=UPI0038B73418
MNGFVFVPTRAPNCFPRLPEFHRVEPDRIRKELRVGLDDKPDPIKPDAGQFFDNDPVQNDVEERSQFWLLRLLRLLRLRRLAGKKVDNRPYGRCVIRQYDPIARDARLSACGGENDVFERTFVDHA